MVATENIALGSVLDFSLVEAHPGASCIIKRCMKTFSFVTAAGSHQGRKQTKLTEPYLVLVSPGSVQTSYSTAVK